MLLALLLYSEPGFPLYEDTYLGRANAHQLYCFAIEVGFGANGLHPVGLDTSIMCHSFPRPTLAVRVLHYLILGPALVFSNKEGFTSKPLCYFVIEATPIILLGNK